MTVALAPGVNTPLPAAAQTVAVRLQAQTAHADLIALLLDGGDRADGDNGVVLFSQPVSAGGAVSLDLASDTLTITLGSLPSAVERVLVVAQADGTPDVTACGTLTATVLADGSAVATAAFATLPAVATLQLVELYRRNGAWKVRALGDGYAEGLAKLLTVHGVDVTDAPAPSAAAPSATPSVAPTPAPAPTRTLRGPIVPETPPAAPVPAPAAPTRTLRGPIAPASPAAPPAPTPPAVPAPSAAPAAQATDPALPSSGINMRKASGKVDLKKGQGPVLMEKTSLITARVSWKSGTDYDVYALVLMRDGTAVDVAAFEAEGVPILMQHAGVKHLGDVQAIPGAKEQEEIIEIRLTPDVLAVVPVAYSAISNGGGSFKDYKVSLSIDNGAGTKITIPSHNASDRASIYTCVPGIIRNSSDGVVIEPLELYSGSGSEARPIVKLEGGEVRVVMDAGPDNLPKDDY